MVVNVGSAVTRVDPPLTPSCRRGQPGPLVRPHQGARFPARLPLSPKLKTPTLGLPFGCPFGPYQSSIALGPRRWLAHPRARRSFVVGARPAAPGNTGHPRRGLVTPARPRNRRVCVPFRSRTLQSHHPFVEGLKGERRRQRSNMAAVARAARPVARAAAGRYGAALASRCARGVISHHATGSS